MVLLEGILVQLNDLEYFDFFWGGGACEDIYGRVTVHHS